MSGSNRVAAQKYPFAWIGAPANVPDINAWTAFVQALRDNLSATWGDTQVAYTTLKKVRKELGLPFIDDSTGEGGSAASHGAWTTDLDTQAQDIHAMVVFTINALNDVLAGKRRLQWNQDARQFEIETLKADLLRLEQQAPSGAPVLIDVSTGQPTHVTGQIGAPVLVWIATFTVSALALPAYYAVDLAAKSLTDVAEQKTMQTIVERQFECVQSGKCTPEQAAALGRAVYDGAKGLRQAKAEQAKQENKPTSDIADAVKTLGWVALGIAGIYLVARIIPTLSLGSGGGAKLLPAHAENPVHREAADEQAATELELYLENEDRFSMLGHGQGRAISLNLWKKWKKNKYDASKAPQAWSYVVESAAKAYAKEFADAKDWSRIFNPATRALVADSLTKQWEDMARSGEFDRYPPAAA